MIKWLIRKLYYFRNNTGQNERIGFEIKYLIKYIPSYLFFDPNHLVIIDEWRIGIEDDNSFIAPNNQRLIAESHDVFSFDFFIFNLYAVGRRWAICELLEPTYTSLIENLNKVHRDANPVKHVFKCNGVSNEEVQSCSFQATLWSMYNNLRHRHTLC